MGESNNKFRNLDDIVFDSRNKKYGAYHHRKVIGAYLLVAFIIGVFIFALVMAGLVLGVSLGHKKSNQTKVESNLINLDDPPPPPPKEEDVIEPKPPPPPQDLVKQVKLIPPEPKKNPPVEEPPPTKKDQDSAALGLENKEGANTTDQGISNGDKNNAPPAPPVDPNAIVDDASKLLTTAQYPGGINELRKFIVDNMDLSRTKYDGDGGKTLVKFVVEKDGSVSGFALIGKGLGSGVEEEIFRVLKRAKKWAPATTKNGSKVRTYFRLPVTIQIP